MAVLKKIKDLNQLHHKEHQLYEVSLEGLHKRAKDLKSTNKFKHVNGLWQPQDYKGYAIVSMLDTNPNNKELSNTLVNFQEQIQESVQLPGNFYMMPQSSFHQTIINTLSGDRFKKHIINKGIEKNYPNMIKNALSETTQLPLASPIKMNFTGLAIFGTAIGILGIINNQQHWDAIMQFREEFYNQKNLNQHDIKRTRPFIAHITLGYIYGNLTLEEKTHLVKVLENINTNFDFSKLTFTINKAELRGYNHLAEFTKESNYPDFKFC